LRKREQEKTKIKKQKWPLPPLCTYSDIINIELPSVGREPECEKKILIFVVILLIFL
jgi:hypothetical protein